MSHTATPTDSLSAQPHRKADEAQQQAPSAATGLSSPLRQANIQSAGKPASTSASASSAPRDVIDLAAESDDSEEGVTMGSDGEEERESDYDLEGPTQLHREGDREGEPIDGQRWIGCALITMAANDGGLVEVQVGCRACQDDMFEHPTLKFDYIQVPDNVDITTAPSPPIADNNTSNIIAHTDATSSLHWTGVQPFKSVNLARPANSVTVGRQTAAQRHQFLVGSWCRKFGESNFDRE